ncbi:MULTISPECIES: L-ribulose-5-phosphate 3-epimerase [Olsenella]|uniref:L-ribulose-5-phosphate 3-epimerase n=1 Tax=Olsenella TaxID=133925 RepID=UPI000780646D|nr:MULTISPECIES: L-ribulose-5-phosphate 3-epimerase [Olsenella]KXB64210.1 putative hexulose-6-phosphate isomerase [Olsenella sp. DNF00959]
MGKSYELGLYEKATPQDLSWEERLQVTAEAGFDYMEISVDESDARQARLDWTAAERGAVVEAMRNTGVPLGSMCLSGHRKWPLGAKDPKKREYALVMMDKALDLACDLGLHIIQLAGYDAYYEEDAHADSERYFAENLAKATEMAASAGVVMGFETMETPFMDTVEKAMCYVDLVGSPFLGVYPDAGNLTNASLIYGKSVADDIATGAGHIFAAHMKATEAGKYRDMLFGQGTTDYEGALSQLVPQGVRRYVCEMWYLGSDAWRDDVAHASEFVREKIDAAMAELG